MISARDKKMLDIKRANERIHAEQIALNNCKMAFETENKQLDYDLVLMGVLNLFKNDHFGFYLVAQQDDVVLASLMITYEWSDWRNALFWWIQSVYVVPSHRQKGIYKKMYERAWSMSRQSEVPVCGFRLYAESNNNTAHKAYINCGMEKCNYVMFEES